MRTAYLDIDGTLLDGCSWSELVRQLLHDGLGEKDPLMRCLAALEDSESSGMAAVAREVPQALKWVPVPALEGASRRAWKRAAKDLMPFAWDLAQLLFRNGVNVVLVSGGPQSMVQHLGDMFLANSVYASDIAPGRGFERIIDSPQKKRNLVRNEAFGRKTDLSRCIAIGNGWNDVGMLDQTGHSVAFEPSAGLREEAEAQGWPIVDRDGLMECVTTLLDLQ